MSKPRRNWKNLRPNTLRDALKACKDFALDKHNLGVELIAERMGLADHFVLYKWLSNGRMPAVMIRPFEEACGCTYVTQWIAASAGKLSIDIPSGKNCTAEEIQELQSVIHAATGELLKFYAGNAEADETLNAIKQAIEGLGWHHANVSQHSQPQLEI